MSEAITDSEIVEKVLTKVLLVIGANGPGYLTELAEVIEASEAKSPSNLAKADTYNRNLQTLLDSFHMLHGEAFVTDIDYATYWRQVISRSQATIVYHYYNAGDYYDTRVLPGPPSTQTAGQLNFREVSSRFLSFVAEKVRSVPQGEQDDFV